ncbi:c-type cytochrome [Allorhodopirellula heiligendammensis]|uniref:Cytochrome c n=1 Tax=Allorhodopirellula heiligendammensis TaxID=2714739 RepID=A0A5C6BUW0_9BACT|nr:c-type cytochrome [Allorhodopirellula heiligendammensis]TWU15642.1 Cytochrome c [Allorhodopirellula heiligendammensis]
MIDNRIAKIFWMGLLAILNSTIVAAESSVPFVSGFERFGRHDEVDQALAGEVLLSELSCTACHLNERISAKGGPQLNGIARRVSQEWLSDYLASPTSVHPGTTMPDVLSGLSQDSKEEVVAALVAFLSTLDEDLPTIKAGGANPVEFEFWKKGDADRGADLYHQVGCVACHAPEASYHVSEVRESSIDQLLEEFDPEELAEMGLASTARRVESVPHGDLRRKYSRRSLTHFLFQPEHFRPSGRMPNLKLAPHEAADIAAHLLQRGNYASDDKPEGLRSTDHLNDRDMVAPSTNTALVETGRKLFVSLGCANCHQAGNTERQAYIPLADLDLTKAAAACLATGTSSTPHGVESAHRSEALADGDAVRRQYPRYPLDSTQTSAITAAIVDLKSRRQVKNDQSEQADLVDRTLLQMNCYGCHTRDALGGVGRYRKPYFETVGGVDLGDEGRLPPPLSGVGRKLKPEWLKRVFRGDPKTTLRPHMTIRMPKFPHGDVMALADRLGGVDGANTAPASEVFATSTTGAAAKPSGEIGRDLMGIGCIECHSFDGQAMPGVVGVDLTGVPDRVFPAWFHDFVMNPAAIKNRTRMPTFFPEGKSQVPHVLGGNASKQIASMWDYLEHSDRLGIPPKIEAERSKNYQLTPTDHPLMLRTFMNGVGMHAIAVGFPSGENFAMDAQEARLAIGWRGEFLDARSTWFERFSPPIDPLGTEPQPLDTGPSFFKINPVSGTPVAVLAEFLGYQLDSDRVPTFRYRCGGYRIEDRIVPAISGGLRRQIHLHSDQANATEKLLFRIIHGTQVTQDATKHQFHNESGLSVQVLSPNQTPVQKEDWMLPLGAADNLELIYRWQ